MSTKVEAPVWATKLPVPIDVLDEVTRPLSELYRNTSIYLKQRGQYLVAYTAGASCDCLRCSNDLQRVMEVAGKVYSAGDDSQMHICPSCGSTSCSMSKDHRHLCDQDPNSLVAQFKKKVDAE